MEDIYQNLSSFSFPAFSVPPIQLSVLRGYDCEHLKLELPVICSAGFIADATYFFSSLDTQEMPHEIRTVALHMHANE